MLIYKIASELREGDVLVFPDAKTKITSVGRYKDTVLVGDRWLDSMGTAIDFHEDEIACVEIEEQS